MAERKEENKNNHAMQTRKDLMICFESAKPFILHWLEEKLL